MEIKRSAIAGTLESSDLLVRIEPDDTQLILEVNSIVKERFGALIESEVMNELNALGITSGRVYVDDKGALDCVVKARVETAVRRACQEEDV